MKHNVAENHLIYEFTEIDSKSFPKLSTIFLSEFRGAAVESAGDSGSYQFAAHIPQNMKTSSLQKSKSAPLWAASFISGTMLALLPVAGFAAGTSSDSGGFNPPVDSRAPYTPKVRSLLNVLTLAEKISLVHWATDPASLGQAGYLPGVPRLGIPPRRDADALGINVTADATALPARLGLGATFDRTAVYAAGQLEGDEGRALGVDLAPGGRLLCRPSSMIRPHTSFTSKITNTPSRKLSHRLLCAPIRDSKLFR